MGLKYKTIQTDRVVLDKVACDRCGKKIKKVTNGGWNQFGKPHSVFHEPSFSAFFHLRWSWGYDSRKDGETHEAALCEDCYDVVFADVTVLVIDYLFGGKPTYRKGSKACPRKPVGRKKSRS